MREICKYFENCNVAKITGRDCSDYEHCETYKFYERYPEPLGVGTIVIPISKLEKDLDE